MPARSDVTSTSRRRVGIGWVPAQTVVRAAPALLAAVVVCAPRAALLTHRAGILTSSRVPRQQVVVPTARLIQPQAAQARPMPGRVLARSSMIGAPPRVRWTVPRRPPISVAVARALPMGRPRQGISVCTVRSRVRWTIPRRPVAPVVVARALPMGRLRTGMLIAVAPRRAIGYRPRLVQSVAAVAPTRCRMLTARQAQRPTAVSITLGRSLIAVTCHASADGVSVGAHADTLIVSVWVELGRSAGVG